ncbi:prepilin-type N-terminal cleavage/methylation domain-containing protein [Nitrosophilus labii]|uniref:prepilin-type N-terminal cleavage/methylation domain-containing protein n=1 Tax=Nitrosophilus labii TaxID=2706014 RepID=UPI001656900E|nr:prepilin-type N-terminal cleavage/methylation domain-containing protein [Nitrosophilus labii]
MKMSNSFTFIEILISVTILSIVGTALLNLSSSDKRLIEYSKEKKNSTMLSTYVYTRYDSKLKNKNAQLYSLIKNDYIVENEDIKKFLKNKKVQINSKEDNKFTIDENSNVGVLFFKIETDIDGFKNSAFKIEQL